MLSESWITKSFFKINSESSIRQSLTQKITLKATKLYRLKPVDLFMELVYRDNEAKNQQLDSKLLPS